MKKRLLFICLGNICRSPAAEGIMRKKVEDRWLNDNFEIDSAGIGAWHAGELPDRRMRHHAALRGYELSMRVRQFQSEDFLRFDYIVVMDEENYCDVEARRPKGSPGSMAQVLRMKDFFRKYQDATSVPDPYYGGDADFELALDLIEDGCEGLLDRLVENE